MVNVAEVVDGLRSRFRVVVGRKRFLSDTGHAVRVEHNAWRIVRPDVGRQEQSGGSAEAMAAENHVALGSPVDGRVERQVLA